MSYTCTSPMPITTPHTAVFKSVEDDQRLEAYAWTFAIGWTFYLVVWLTSNLVVFDSDLPLISRLVTALPCAIISTLFAIACHRRWWSHATLRHFGKALAMLSAIAAVVIYGALLPPQTTGRPPQSWGLMVGMFMTAVLLPMSIRWAASLLFTSASLPLLAYLLQRVAGLPSMDAEPLFHWIVSPYIAAAVALVTVYYVDRWRAHLQSARSRITELGSYELVRKLGHGGMGEVWQGRHRLLACPAAVKLIKSPPPHLEATMRHLFEQEAQVTALLNSLHTVKVYDFGQTEDGAFYYVMELLSGMNLHELVRDFGPQPSSRVRHFLVQACDALAEAHEIGIVHRDIKPSNLYLCSLGTQRDVIKVLDFGLVMKAAFRTDEKDLQSINDLRGTPGFMAPEQARTGATIDGRADIYGLGCCAYYLLSGEPVFSGSGTLELVRKHATESPVPLHERAELNVDRGLSDLVMACLAKKPDERIQSARALRYRLEHLPLSPWHQDDADAWYRSPRSTHPQPAARVASEAAVSTMVVDKIRH